MSGASILLGSNSTYSRWQSSWEHALDLGKKKTFEEEKLQTRKPPSSMFQSTLLSRFVAARWVNRFAAALGSESGPHPIDCLAGLQFCLQSTRRRSNIRHIAVDKPRAWHGRLRELLSALALGSAFTLPFGGVNAVGRRLWRGRRCKRSAEQAISCYNDSSHVGGRHCRAIVMVCATANSWTTPAFVLISVLPVLSGPIRCLRQFAGEF